MVMEPHEDDVYLMEITFGRIEPRLESTLLPLKCSKILTRLAYRHQRDSAKSCCRYFI